MELCFGPTIRHWNLASRRFPTREWSIQVLQYGQEDPDFAITTMHKKKDLTFVDMILLFLLLITLFEGMFNVVVVFVVFHKSNCGCCGCCCSNIMVIILLTFCFDRSFMIEPSVKKAVAQRGWIPLNMNCLYHPDIITTKVMEDNQRKEDLERNVLRNNMGVAIDLTEADVQAATDGPGAIQEFNW